MLPIHRKIIMQSNAIKSIRSRRNLKFKHIFKRVKQEPVYEKVQHSPTGVLTKHNTINHPELDA